jgi:hypothetical protein
MKLATTCIAALLTFSAFAQSAGELDNRGGYKTIRLLDPIDSVKGYKLKKEFTEKGNVYPSAIYEVNHPDYMTIGEIGVNTIEIETYNGKIYRIYVYTEKDERLMKAMENVLGKSTYNSRENLYFWSTERILLTFQSHGKKELKLVYRSNVIPKLMKEDREKKVETISSDF